MLTICTLFCLVDSKKHSFLSSCVFWFVFLNAISPWGSRQRIGPQPPWLVVGGNFYCHLFFCLISRLLALSTIFLKMLSKFCFNLFRSFGPKGGQALLMCVLCGISGLSFDSIFLSAPLLFCLVLLLILSSSFCFWPSLLPTFQKQF